MPVADQDRALKFYRDVLGCEVRIDTEIWPGARIVEVAPPGSNVGIILLPPDGDIPVAVRLGTPNAQEAHARIRAAGVTMHDDEVLQIDGAPPMFSFTDPDGNGLVYLENAPETTDT